MCIYHKSGYNLSIASQRSHLKIPPFLCLLLKDKYASESGFTLLHMLKSLVCFLQREFLYHAFHTMDFRKLDCLLWRDVISVFAMGAS